MTGKTSERVVVSVEQDVPNLQLSTEPSWGLGIKLLDADEASIRPLALNTPTHCQAQTPKVLDHSHFKDGSCQSTSGD